MPAIPLPPEPMPRWHRGRPRKAWRWVGVFAPELVLCAGRAEVAGVPQRFWAVWEPARDGLREHTALRAPARRLLLQDDNVRVREHRVAIDLRLEDAGVAITVRSPHGGSWIWTRKRPVRAVGTVWLGDRAVVVDAPGLVDDSAGYHARDTEWWWAAGAGLDVDGRTVVWNLVHGVHDAAAGSERRVWVDGAAREVGAVTFGPDLTHVGFAEGGGLAFAAGAARERHERRLGGLLRSDYVQPLGTVTGELPGGVRLAGATGVMEHHRARW
jgi:Protein of unknown function (DUF2804)